MNGSDELTPRQIVEEIDKYVVGQADAKRSVAIALRNRFRRQRVPGEFREEITPKNILMIGPTGVGKTEIARRVAKLVNAPFLKVEATKFTEVGYVGRDVDSIVRDLVETSVRIVKSEHLEEVRERAEARAEERLLDLLAPLPKKEAPKNPFEAIFGSRRDRESDEEFESRLEEATALREEVKRRLAAGEMEDYQTEVEVDETSTPIIEVFDGSNISEMGVNFQDMFGGLFPRKKKKRRVSVSEARRLLAQEEAQKLIDMDAVSAEAIRRAEQSGIVFIDEMDKIAGREKGLGPD
ncbi:MAG: AAA family ATPase, partial [Firmicutes bacterium]|nr:AAA family ATPase [Bacillota bacterium]